MQTAFFSVECRPVLLLLLFYMFCSKGRGQVIPLANGFAHNDYWHARPLFDAMEQGFTHMEADIYLRKGKLIVAHVLPSLKAHHTLERLYLTPLWHCVEENKLTCPNQPITLTIDIKSGARKTYRELKRVLERYRSMLTSYNNGVIVYRAVTIVLTGHKPDVSKEENRIVFIDADLFHIEENEHIPKLSLLASCKYSRILSWNGTGEMPLNERDRLRQYVRIAHQYGHKVRLWASPENEAVWNALLNCGVDLINTDRLQALREFLLNYSGTGSLAKETYLDQLQKL